MRGYATFAPTNEEIENAAKIILKNQMNETDTDFNKFLKPIVTLLTDCKFYFKRIHPNKEYGSHIWYGLIVERAGKRSKEMHVGIAPVRVWSNDTEVRLNDFADAISIYGSDADQFCETKEHERIYRKQQKALLKLFEPHELRDIGACCAE